MNYEKIYDALIASAKIRQLNKTKSELIFELEYIEKHHIIPKSFFMTNHGWVTGDPENFSNLVWLTGKEHFLAHLLIWKIYKNRQAFSAVWRLCHGKQNIKINSRIYEKLKIEHVKQTKERNKNHPNIINKWRRVYVDGSIYNSIVEAASYFKLHPSSIRTRCTSTNIIYKTWSFILPNGELTKENLLLSDRNYHSVAISINGKYYKSITLAAKELNLKYSMVFDRCKSKNIKFSDWIILQNNDATNN